MAKLSTNPYRQEMQISGVLHSRQLFEQGTQMLLNLRVLEGHRWQSPDGVVMLAGLHSHAPFMRI